ncbi:MAG: cell division protein ZapB [Candidatus Electrothrix communis]|nr:hypothetical protein [Desulfobulbus sp. US4]WLE97737.1 MAG: cell division protein ZapB [Candidatus Electrothrix communis]
MGIIYNLLKDIPVSAALAERIKIIEAEVDKIKDENTALKEEKDDLLVRISQLEQERSEQNSSENEFAEHCGVKFKRVPSGEYDKTIPYCPDCEKAMFANHRLPRITHECSSCGFRAPFTARQIQSVTKDLFS